MDKIYKPGELAPSDGMYIKVNEKGVEINNAFQLKKGDKFPPSQSKNVNYKKK